MTERFRQMSEEYESKGLAMPFKGITTNGEVVPGLFEIKPSGVSTEPLRGLWPNLYLSSAVRGTGCVTGRVST